MTKKIILTAVVVLLLQTTYLAVYAVKAYPFAFTVTQPDGTQLTIYLRGDEFSHFQTTEDGYLLKENSKGFLTYATINQDGNVAESAVIARDIKKRTTADIQFLKSINQSDINQKIQNFPRRTRMVTDLANQPRKVFPMVGSPKSIIILVNFKDTSFVTPTPQMAFTNLLNQNGYSTNGGTGSARDYFMSSSYGKFSPTYDVYGPFNLPNNMAFYGANDSKGNDVNAVQMIVDACTAASNAGVDFSQYDTDNNGYIDNVFVYYAGYNEAEGGPKNSIWPHRWSVEPGSNYSGSTASITFNGKILYDYACTSELRGKTGANMCGIGTFCHEFGHVLGLPDFYDTSGSTIYKTTLETWDVMDTGPYLNLGRTPPTYSAYERFFLGYLSPEQKSSTANLSLYPIYQGKTQPPNTTGQAYLFSVYTHNLIGSNPSPSEFYMVEYRKKTGWDSFLPAEGMCIWHIDYNPIAWANNTLNNYTESTQTASSHMRVYLQPLNGSTSTPGNAFTSGSFTPITWSGVDINRAIIDITKTTELITFSIMPPRLSTNGNITAFSTTLGATSTAQSISVLAQNFNGNLNITLQNNANFDIKQSTDTVWTKSLSLPQSSGVVNTTLQVRYNPKTTGNQTDQLSISGNGLTTSILNLSGTATIGPNSPVIFAGKTIDNSLAFPITPINSTNTKTLNIKTTDINSNLNFVISGVDASMFSVSTNTVIKDVANTVLGTNITVNFLPTSAGNHTATLTISGGGISPDKVITLSGLGI